MTNKVMKTWPVEKKFLKAIKRIKKSFKDKGYDIKALEYYDDHDAVFFVVTHNKRLRSVVIYQEPYSKEFEDNVLAPAEWSVIEGLESMEIIDAEIEEETNEENN